MYRSILVPLDGSGFGEHALPIAIGIARRTGATITLARAVPLDAPPIPWAPGLPVQRGDQQLPPTDQQQRAREYLDALVERVVRVGQVDAQAMLLVGDVVPALLQLAQEIEAELIVLTTHGRGGLSRAMLGSVADSLVRESATPVLAVRPRPEPPVLHQDEPLPRMLLALDGSANDERIIRQAERLGCAAAAEVLLLRVVSPIVHRDRPTAVQIDRDDLRRLRAEADEYLEPIRERLERAGLQAKTYVLSDDEPESAILRFAAEEDVSVIAMATRGLGGIERIVMGSVADRVLRGSTADVLLYRG